MATQLSQNAYVLQEMTFTTYLLCHYLMLNREKQNQWAPLPSWKDEPPNQPYSPERERHELPLTQESFPLRLQVTISTFRQIRTLLCDISKTFLKSHVCDQINDTFLQHYRLASSMTFNEVHPGPCPTRWPALSSIFRGFHCTNRLTNIY